MEKGRGKGKEKKGYLQIKVQRSKRSLQEIKEVLIEGGKSSARSLKMVVFNKTLSSSILQFFLERNLSLNIF